MIIEPDDVSNSLGDGALQHAVVGWIILNHVQGKLRLDYGCHPPEALDERSNVGWRAAENFFTRIYCRARLSSLRSGGEVTTLDRSASNG